MFAEAIHLHREAFDMPPFSDLTLQIDRDGRRHRLITESFPEAVEVSDEVVQSILAEISGLNIPLSSALSGIIGCDGTTYALTIISGFQEVKFKWWCEPPKGWEALARIASMLEGLWARRDGIY